MSPRCNAVPLSFPFLTLPNTNTNINTNTNTNITAVCPEKNLISRLSIDQSCLRVVFAFSFSGIHQPGLQSTMVYNSPPCLDPAALFTYCRLLRSCHFRVPPSSFYSWLPIAVLLFPSSDSCSPSILGFQFQCSYCRPPISDFRPLPSVLGFQFPSSYFRLPISVLLLFLASNSRAPIPSSY